MIERETAFRLLQRIELDGDYAAPLLAGQSNFVRELVLGVLRWRLRLDYLISKIAERPLGKLDQRVVQILREAIYEVMYMNTPAYAVVNDAVSLAARHAWRARSFVNAILRRATATDLHGMLPVGPDRSAVELAHPAWLLEKWSVQFGRERAREIAAADQQPSRADLLVNTRALSASEAEAILTRKQLPFARSELADRVLRLESSSAPLREEIEEGLFHPMDEGSACIASLVGRNNRRVLDAAAAPGGKSLFMTLAGHRVVSHDVSLTRLMMVQRGFRRFGLPNRATVAGDATRPSFRQRFDAVLIDAPCSGSGTLRKNPEIKWRLDAGCFARFAAVQRDLLNAALSLAADECIYSTCSLEREENDEVVAAVLAAHPDFELADPASRLSPSGRRWIDGQVLRLTPESGADGFTAFLLRRRR